MDRNGLADLYVDLAVQRRSPRIPFVVVHERAGIGRSYAYKLAPGGVRTLAEDLHRELMEQILSDVRTVVRGLGLVCDVTAGIEAGVIAFANGLSECRLTADVLVYDPGALAGYLLSPCDGALINVISEFVTTCAELFGSLESDARLRTLAHKFVAGCVGDIASAAVANGLAGVSPVWPDKGQTRAFARPRITTFTRALCAGKSAHSIANHRLKTRGLVLAVPATPTLVPDRDLPS